MIQLNFYYYHLYLDVKNLFDDNSFVICFISYSLFSSPKPKAYVSLFRSNLSVVRRTCLVVVVVAVVVVNFSHFHLLLNH